MEAGGLASAQPIRTPMLSTLLDAPRTAIVPVAFFLVFSGINHAVDAVRRRNFAWQNVHRPFIALLLVAGMVYPVVLALKGP
jgi:hypothetical protein